MVGTQTSFTYLTAASTALCQAPFPTLSQLEHKLFWAKDWTCFVSSETTASHASGELQWGSQGCTVPVQHWATETVLSVPAVGAHHASCYTEPQKTSPMLCATHLWHVAHLCRCKHPTHAVPPALSVRLQSTPHPPTHPLPCRGRAPSSWLPLPTAQASSSCQSLFRLY